MSGKAGSAKGDLPSGRLRPGIAFPDWSAARSPAARAAVRAIVAATGEVEGWSGCGATADRVRRAILRDYAALGRAPSSAELERGAELPQAALHAALDELAARDMIVRDDAGVEVTGAYPFTNADTGHRVRLDGLFVNAMCAIDALGAASMLGRDAAVEGACAQCSRPVHAETASRGARIGRADPAGVCVWAGLCYHGSAAASLCRSIVFFCSAEHRSAWRAAGGAEGIALSLSEALEAGRALFAPLLAEAEPPASDAMEEARR